MFIQPQLILIGLMVLTLSACDRVVINESEPGRWPVKKLHETLREHGWRSTSAALGIGGGYSFLFQVKPAHQSLAEYYHRVFIFAGSARDGRFVGALKLRMNTGGRTHVLIYRYLNEQGVPTHVGFEHRVKDTIHLATLEFAQAPPMSRKEFVGTMSGAAFPEKFLTPLVLSEAESLKLLE